MEKLLKTLRRTANLEGLTNGFSRQALKEIRDAYRGML